MRYSLHIFDETTSKDIIAGNRDIAYFWWNKNANKQLNKIFKKCFGRPSASGAGAPSLYPGKGESYT